MIKIIKSLLLVLFITSFAVQANSETSWITKKSDKTKKEIKIEKKIKKAEIKKTNEWIKKKVKENKKEFKEEDKKITKEVKSWITKKDKKDKYIDNADSLPSANIYFAAKSDNGKIFYGYVNADLSSKKIGNYYETSKGKGYFNDGKTICQIASTVIDLFEGDITGRVAGNCSDGTKFRGNFTQNMNLGYGIAKTNNGEKFEFDFTSKKNETVKLVKNFKSQTTTITRNPTSPNNNKNIKLEPNGKYYALLIGNSKYNNWDNLVSPEKDVNEIKNVLEKSYKFERIISVFNGSKKDILSAFRELSEITTTNDYVLIYYSGHGEIEAQQAYWVPKDGSKSWGNDDWIGINYIDIYIRDKIKAHHIAVLVDSCYVGGKFKGLNLLDNMTEEDSKIFAKQLESDLNSRSRSVLSSGSNGPVSDTVAGTNHSRFALTFLNLLKEFEKSSIPVNLKSIAWNMDRYFAGTSQRPHYYHPPTWIDGGGDFIFIPKKNLK